MTATNAPPVLADRVSDIPWFPAVLASARETLAQTPEHSWPSWYAQHRKGGS